MFGLWTEGFPCPYLRLEYLQAYKDAPSSYSSISVPSRDSFRKGRLSSSTDCANIYGGNHTAQGCGNVIAVGWGLQTRGVSG